MVVEGAMTPANGMDDSVQGSDLACCTLKLGDVADDLRFSRVSSSGGLSRVLQ